MREALPRLSVRHGLTTVVAVAELFEVFESPGALAVAVFVIVPFCVGLTTIVTVADAPSAIAPRLQVTVRFAGFRLQLPCVVDAEPKPAFLGS